MYVYLYQIAFINNQELDTLEKNVVWAAKLCIKNDNMIRVLVWQCQILSMVWLCYIEFHEMESYYKGFLLYLALG